jgi:hypothetical protein
MARPKAATYQLSEGHGPRRCQPGSRGHVSIAQDYHVLAVRPHATASPFVLIQGEVWGGRSPREAIHSNLRRSAGEDEKKNRFDHDMWHHVYIRMNVKDECFE